VSAQGNWEGKNILWRAQAFDAFAQAQNMIQSFLYGFHMTIQKR
jgi:hypothetical protein